MAVLFHKWPLISYRPHHSMLLCYVFFRSLLIVGWFLNLGRFPRQHQSMNLHCIVEYKNTNLFTATGSDSKPDWNCSDIHSGFHIICQVMLMTPSGIPSNARTVLNAFVTSPRIRDLLNGLCSCNPLELTISRHTNFHVWRGHPGLHRVPDNAG